MYDYLVGYARRNISPEDSVPLSGYGDGFKRFHVRQLDPLYASAVAITDRKGVTTILVSTDLVWFINRFVEPVRTAVEKATGVPGTNIMLASTHTHSGVEQGSTLTPYMERYNEMYTQRVIEAAIAAFEDRKEAEMYGAITETDGLNFCRHYVHEDGTISGPGFGTSKTPKVGHKVGPDPEMRLVQFKRKDGKDIVMMNWQAHATMMSYRRPETRLFCSADFVGFTRMYMEKELGCHFIYFQGAAGNMMPTSDIDAENKDSTFEGYAALLGGTAIAALEKAEKMPAGDVKVRCQNFEGKCRHKWDHKVEDAKKVIEYVKETGDLSGANKLAQQLGFSSRTHASVVPSRAALPQTLEVEASLVTIGDLAVATSENEIFCEIGQRFRAGSPYPINFLLSSTNGQRGYLPDRRTFEYGSYETDITYFEEGTGEELADYYIENLKQMKEEA